MKPEEPETGNPEPVAGDVIGDTAYSERFVLKILLKLANLDTLKDEIQEKSFEEDLCTLWDMTAERDVVLFLQKHNVLNLFNFALPMVDSPRIVEIIVGIIGNMCCQNEVVESLLKMKSFITSLLEYVKTDDSLIVIQVLRLVSACLYIANDDYLAAWMAQFKSIDYSTALYFILTNSSHKNLLVTALENFNTVSSYCNTEKLRNDFFSQFVKLEALESLCAAFTEVTITQKDSCERDELDRILIISLQITLNLLGFDKSEELYENSKENILKIISNVMNYYESKLDDLKEIDSDLVDVVDSTNTITNILKLSERSSPDKYFSQSYSIWKTLKKIMNTDKNGCNFEDETTDGDLFALSGNIKSALGMLMCSYMDKCTEDHLLNVLDDIRDDYEEILSLIPDETVRTNVSLRASNYRTRLKDTVDS